MNQSPLPRGFGPFTNAGKPPQLPIQKNIL